MTLSSSKEKLFMLTVIWKLEKEHSTSTGAIFKTIPITVDLAQTYKYSCYAAYSTTGIATLCMNRMVCTFPYFSSVEKQWKHFPNQGDTLYHTNTHTLEWVHCREA